MAAAKSLSQELAIVFVTLLAYSTFGMAVWGGLVLSPLLAAAWVVQASAALTLAYLRCVWQLCRLSWRAAVAVFAVTRWSLSLTETPQADTAATETHKSHTAAVPASPKKAASKACADAATAAASSRANSSDLIPAHRPAPKPAPKRSADNTARLELAREKEAQHTATMVTSLPQGDEIEARGLDRAAVTAAYVRSFEAQQAAFKAEYEAAVAGAKGRLAAGSVTHDDIELLADVGALSRAEAAAAAAAALNDDSCWGGLVVGVVEDQGGGAGEEQEQPDWL